MLSRALNRAFGRRAALARSSARFVHTRSRATGALHKSDVRNVVTFPENNFSSGIKVTFSNGKSVPEVTSADLDFEKRAEQALARAEESETWSEDQVRQAAQDHVMTTWSATRPSLEAYPVVERTDGVYFYTKCGKKMIDFSSQAMCTNFGDSMPDPIMQSIIDQMKMAPMIWGEASLVPVRSQLSRLLADICPGDLNKFVYTSSGAEANEAAIRAARLYTGRRKIMSRYRSYHGSTSSCLALSGDFRRTHNEPLDPSVVHFHCPYPYAFKWSETDDPQEICEKSLAYFRETLIAEGPSTVAAVYIESVTGTNGVLAPPPGYLEGIRELCDEHGILMICDEV
jgi:taurine--2-oxoglutarate transaminase